MSGRSWRDRPPISQGIRTPHKAIVAELRAMIERGDIVPGQPVGSLADLADMYGVARSTAHKALRAAAAEGLIDQWRGGQYRVPG